MSGQIHNPVDLFYDPKVPDLNQTNKNNALLKVQAYIKKRESTLITHIQQTTFFIQF